MHPDVTAIAVVATLGLRQAAAGLKIVQLFPQLRCCLFWVHVNLQLSRWFCCRDSSGFYDPLLLQFDFSLLLGRFFVEDRRAFFCFFGAPGVLREAPGGPRTFLGNRAAEAINSLTPWESQLGGYAPSRLTM